MKRRMFKENKDSVTIEEVEKMYGVKVANALIQYCDETGKKAYDVLNDTTEDKNGMTKWDWFDKWAKRTLKLDIMGDFDDDFDYTGVDSKPRRDVGLSEYETPTFNESVMTIRCEVMNAIDEYAQAMVDKAMGDKTAGMAAKIAYDKIQDLLSQIY